VPSHHHHALLTVPIAIPGHAGAAALILHSPAAGDGATLPGPAGPVAAHIHPQAPLFPRDALMKTLRGSGRRLAKLEKRVCGRACLE